MKQLTTSRRAVRAALAAAALPIAPAVATAIGGLPAAPDPIHAVLAEHRAALTMIA